MKLKGESSPHQKDDDIPLYPPNALKPLPKSIAKRILDTLSSKDIFEKPISISQNAFYDIGFKEQLKNTPSDTNFQEENNQRAKRRKIIWFNTPYLKSVKNNIRDNFLHLLVKHYQANNKMHKTFNKNAVKVSYNCRKNMDSIMSVHNHNILNAKQKLFVCNCRKKVNCTFNDKCLTQ